MEFPTGTKEWNLSVFLIKEDIKDHKEIIDTLPKPKYFSVPIEGGQVDIYVKQVFPREPEWVKFLDPYVPATDIGRSSSPAAVLLLNVRNRVFAVTFGSGRFLLSPNCWEERFGLKVALNSISDSQIKSLDKKTFDSISSQTRMQAIKESDVRDFGLDIERDLLRAVTGKPDDKTFGSRMSGMDSLNVRVNTDLESLSKTLEILFDKSNEKGYKKKFPWVDQIMEITDKSVSGKLDQLLVDKLNSNDLDEIELAVPEIVDFSAITGFKYGLTSKSLESYDIDIRSFLAANEHQEFPLTVDRLRTRPVIAVNDHIPYHRWTAYKCIYAEIDYEDKKYLLNAGKWYSVDPVFVMEVNSDMALIPKYDKKLPKYDHTDEGNYNEDVAMKSKGVFTLFDKKNIVLGHYNKFEFCDLFSQWNDIIHVKRFGQSNVFSHLFAQGYVSAETFLYSSECREKVNKRLPIGNRIADTKLPLKSSNYRVVYAIVSDRPGDLHLPVFSRVNLRQAWRRLTGFGYRVALSKIEVEEIKSVTRKVKPKKIKTKLLTK